MRASIIIASELQARDVRRCLGSLAAQVTAADEVIVVHSGPPLDLDSLSAGDMALVLVQAPPGASIPDLRYRGWRRAQGAIVVMTEASAVFTPGWLERVVALHGNGFDAVGGAIDPIPAFDLVSWTAHLCEYGAYMSPLADRKGGDFSGFHASYGRALLERCESSISERHWETVLHEEARRHGARFLRCGELQVLNTRRHSIGTFLAQRFAYGRGYGAVRGLRTSAAAHLVLLFATAALPALMMVRYARWGVRKRLGTARMVRAAPLLLLFALGWSVGEWVGYVEAVSRRFRGAGG